jgi:hypothetical protein
MMYDEGMEGINKDQLNKTQAEGETLGSYRRLYQPHPTLPSCLPSSRRRDLTPSATPTPKESQLSGHFQRAKPFQEMLREAILALKRSTVIRADFSQSAQQRSSSYSCVLLRADKSWLCKLTTSLRPFIS